MLRSYSEGQSQIQLELAEHENQVLKSKLAKIEKEHEELSSRANLLEKQVNRSGGRTTFSERELTAAVPDTYYKQKIKLLEVGGDPPPTRTYFCPTGRSRGDQAQAGRVTSRRAGSTVRSGERVEVWRKAYEATGV